MMDTSSCFIHKNENKFNVVGLARWYILILDGRLVSSWSEIEVDSLIHKL